MGCRVGGTPSRKGAMGTRPPGNDDGEVVLSTFRAQEKTPAETGGYGISSVSRACARKMGSSRDFQVLGRGLASIGDELVLDHLALVESVEASAFHSRDVDEDVLISGRWSDEPVALGRIEPLDGALVHRLSPGLKSILTRNRNAATRATTRLLERSEAIALSALGRNGQ